MSVTWLPEKETKKKVRAPDTGGEVPRPRRKARRGRTRRAAAGRR